MGRALKYKNGRFFLMQDVPGIILPLEVYIRIKQEYLNSLGEEGRKKIIEIVYKQGKLAGKRYRKEARSPPKLRDFLKGIVKTLGFGKISFLELNKSKIVYKFSTSPVAETTKDLFGEQEKPTCLYALGISKGIFEEYFENKYEAKETMCKGKGDEFCKLVFVEK